jgi:hypothetical protein
MMPDNKTVRLTNRVCTAAELYLATKVKQGVLMKDVFRGFYSTEKPVLKELWKDEKTLFIFDTNVFLNLYGYAKKTRDDFFSILKVVNEKLWIPHHVGLEYQRRRLDVIRNEKTVFNDIEKNLEKVEKIFKGDFEKLALKRRFPKLFESTDKLENEINKSISNYRKSVQHWDNKQPCVRSHDEIRDKLDKFFDGKIGDKPTDQKWLDNLYKEGEDRFKKKIPPGFKDAGKGNVNDETHFTHDGLYYERQYGDLILWKQLIDMAKIEGIENVIFITDDAKDDWWYQIDSNGKKTIGPLAELQTEIYREAKIKNFHMYSTSMFLEDGKSNLAVDVSESSIEDANAPHITERSDDLTLDQLFELKDTHIARAYYNDHLREFTASKNSGAFIENKYFRDAMEEEANSRSVDVRKAWREAMDQMDSSRSADVRKAWREAMDQMDSSRSADVRKAWREAMDQEDNRRSNEDVLLNEMLGSKSKSRIQKESDKSYKALYKSLRKKDEDEPS